MGTSATLFNAGIYNLATANSTLQSLLGKLLTDILDNDADIAQYPNPFQGLGFQQDGNATTTRSGEKAEEETALLNLVDGGEDNENVPLWPLLHPERNVDVILSIDASADTGYFWPNGR